MLGTVAYFTEWHDGEVTLCSHEKVVYHFDSVEIKHLFIRDKQLLTSHSSGEIVRKGDIQTEKNKISQTYNLNDGIDRNIRRKSAK